MLHNGSSEVVLAAPLCIHQTVTLLRVPHIFREIFYLFDFLRSFLLRFLRDGIKLKDFIM